MWDDPKQLNAMSGVLVMLAAAALCWAALIWLVRQPAFAFRQVIVSTPQ
jgi:hypothetical protein